MIFVFFYYCGLANFLSHLLRVLLKVLNRGSAFSIIIKKFLSSFFIFFTSSEFPAFLKKCVQGNKLLQHWHNQFCCAAISKYTPMDWALWARVWNVGCLVLVSCPLMIPNTFLGPLSQSMVFLSSGQEPVCSTLYTSVPLAELVSVGFRHHIVPLCYF